MFLTENEVVYMPEIKEEMDYEKMVKELDLQSENIYVNFPVNEGRKRMRLHQLSWEEKIQRKKLRNRIAAQTSRDRKKAKMDHLEESVKSLKQQNELLFMQIEELKRKNEILVDANTELQKALAQRPYTCSCLNKTREEEKKEIMEISNEIKEQICVEDGHFFDRPAESSEIPQQKGSLPTSAQKMADFKGDTFLDDFERLVSDMLEEAEQHESRRNTEPIFQEVSRTGQKKCTNNTEVVGKTSEELESSRSQIILAPDTQKHCFETILTTEEKILFISSEHSYAASENPHCSTSKVSKPNVHCLDYNVPTITISESEKIFEIENELKKDIESKVLSYSENNVDSLTFPNFGSPKSEVSSDQGYESVSPFYESDTSKEDAFDEFNDLLGDSFSELFPELL